MILPLSDAPNPRGTPFVTYALIAVNVAVYLLINLPLGQRAPDPTDPALADYLRTLMQVLPAGVSIRDVLEGVSAYDLLVFSHGFRPAAPQAIDLLTSMFLHGGFMHLFGNMLFLWIYGDNVEHRLGPVRYLLMYLVTGAAATLIYAAFAPRSLLPLVGASGAISGILGFYFLWFPRNTVRLFVFLFPFFLNVIEIPARIVLGIYLLIDNLLPFLLQQGNQGGGVAHGAHLGGFVAGLAIAWYHNQRDLRAEPADFRRTTSVPQPPPLPNSVRAALAAQDHATAAQLYFDLPPQHSRRLLSPAESLQLADWLATHNHPEAALTVYRRHLRDFPGGPGLAEAHLGAGLIQLHVLRQVAPAFQHFVEALESDPSETTAQRARAALQDIRHLQKYGLSRFTR